ncbi:MAG: hypothetical protein ACOCU0_03225 [Bacillota bacterium]
MKVLMLKGIGCTDGIYEFLNLSEHDVSLIDYEAVMNSDTDSVETLALNINHALNDRSFDAIIAHSMGGLLAMVLLEKGWVEASSLIAIETSFVPAHESYRTLLHPKSGKALHHAIDSMLQKEIPKYPEKLKASLRDAFDFESTLSSLTIPITMIYGKREMEACDELRNKLNLREETLEKVSLHFVENAAHFPFVENPDETHRVLKNALTTRP